MQLVSIYLANMIGYMLFSLPFYILGRIVYLKILRKQTILVQEVLLLFFVLYIVGLASQTVIPSWDMGIYSDSGEFFFNLNLSNANAQLNLIPFHTVYEFIFRTNVNVDEWGNVSLLNITANILLFAPLGFIVPILWKKRNQFKSIVQLGFSVTIFVEIIQFFIGRSTDIDDVILNILGVILGYGILSISKIVFNKKNLTGARVKD